MADDTQRYDRAVSTLSRRRALAGGGAALLTAGGTLVWVADGVDASVTIGEFAVSDASFTNDAADPVLDVTVGYDYDAGSAPVSELVLSVSVDGTEIATQSLSTSVSTHAGEETLSGHVVDSEAWAAEDFAPAVSSSVEQTVGVTIDFAVLESDDSEIVSASASDDAVISVAHPQESQYVAEIGGVGSFTDANE